MDAQWFPDPEDPTQFRFFDGTNWTNQYKPVLTHAPSPNLISTLRPSAEFQGASWLVLIIGAVAFLSTMYTINASGEAKSTYITATLFALFGSVALAKSVRDRAEGIPVSGLFLGLSFAAVAIPATVLAWMLWQSDFTPQTAWLIFITATLMVFAVVAIQKNIRDKAVCDSVGL